MKVKNPYVNEELITFNQLPYFSFNYFFTLNLSNII
jgi:hypothetical protein